MAGKVKPRSTFILIILMVAISLSAIIWFNPGKNTVIPLKLNQGSHNLPVDPAFSSPKNVKIMGVGANQYDSLVITWDYVPGAKGYYVYSTNVIPDTTVWVPFSYLDLASGLSVYSYSFHPRYGDMYNFRLKEEGQQGIVWKQWKQALITPWVKDSLGIMTGCRYAIPTSDSMQMEKWYRVTAWR